MDTTKRGGRLQRSGDRGHRRPSAELAADPQQGKVSRVGILSPGGVPDPSVATTPTLAKHRLPTIYEWRDHVDRPPTRQIAVRPPSAATIAPVT
jgi:hypothetical protein